MSSHQLLSPPPVTSTSDQNRLTPGGPTSLLSLSLAQPRSSGSQNIADDDAVPTESEIPHRRRRGLLDGAIPKVADETGETVRQTFEIFLDNFVEKDADANDEVNPEIAEKYYIAQIRGLKQFNLMTLYLDYSHLQDYQNGVLAEAIASQYYRFLPFLTKGLHAIIQKCEPEYFRNMILGDSANIIHKATNSTDRSFSIAFYNLPSVTRIRECRTDSIGKLIAVSGTITRTSEVRPELNKGTFICGQCRTVVTNVEQIYRYTTPTQCPNETCNNRLAWTLDIPRSNFVDWQKVRIQENSNEIPTGSMPRTLDVILRNEIVDRAKAGDKCIFIGTLIVVPDVMQLGIPGVTPSAMKDWKSQNRGSSDGVTGLKELGVRDLTYKLAFLACMVQSADTREGTIGDIRGDGSQGEEEQDEFLNSMSKSEIEDLKSMVHSDHIYSRLVNSIAPTIYGHEMVKKGILLQLMGGVHKQTQEGINLRGDINICIVGDPSTSKSQFLKYVCGFLPRAVYTSGKSSSAAGLTASVIKDEETGEFTIEAGALMLADNGICAIDEFDKMDIADQVAIHEAMEQQTISIAKAGLQATLNARTSVLAAANPVGGRYNRRTTLRNNINMSAPIMSRFDLFFVILDECNENIDTNIAQHIVKTHFLQDESIDSEFSTEQIQRYIRYARTLKPKLTKEAQDLIVEKYKELRSNDSEGIGRRSYRITVRQLESMIRLSEAIARTNCVEDITPAFVREAYNLLRQSIIRVEMDDVGLDDDDDQQDAQKEGAEMSAAADNNGMQQECQKSENKQKKTKITYEQYQAILRMLLKPLEEDEKKDGNGIEGSELVQYYLEQKEDQIDSEEQLEEQRFLVRKVIKRLVKDSYLMEVRGSESLGHHDIENTVFVLHPNCSLETVNE